MTTTKPHILLIEDNEGDVILIEEAFEECSKEFNLTIARDGGEAMDYLFKRDDFNDDEKPDLILLDINLPRYNGHEILKKLKQDKALKRIPVIMLTTSTRDKDIEMAYEAHCNAFISKSLEMDDFISSIVKITEFWFDVVTLP